MIEELIQKINTYKSVEDLVVDYNDLKSLCSKNGLTLYALHTLISHLRQDLTTNNQESQQLRDEQFIDVESDDRIIGDCSKCKISEEIDALEYSKRKLDFNIGGVKQEKLDLLLKIKKQKNRMSVILISAFFFVVLVSIISISIVRSNEYRSKINENKENILYYENKVVLLKSQAEKLNRERDSLEILKEDRQNEMFRLEPKRDSLKNALNYLQGYIPKNM